MARRTRNKHNDASSRLGEPISDQKARSSLNRSQDVTARPTLKLLAYVSEEATVVNSNMEFHMTIRPRVELTPRAASMLLAIANARALLNGVDFTLYLAMEYLSSYLTKSGYDTMTVKNERVRQTLLVAELILTQIKGTWFNFREREEIPLEIFELIASTGWVPSDRVLQSWKQHWDLERYLSVRIVPVEHFLNRTPTTAERYSSYTRGYGQDGNAPTPGKTRPSAELDGEELDESPPHITLQEFESYQTVLLAIERAKAEKRRK